MNGRFFRCLASSGFSITQHLLRCARMQRENQIHSMGSQRPSALRHNLRTKGHSDRRARPKADLHHLVNMLRCGPSKWTFIHCAAFYRVKRRCADEAVISFPSRDSCFRKSRRSTFTCKSATLVYRSSMDDSNAQSVLAKCFNASMNLMAARSKRPGRIPFARMRAGPCIPIDHAA